MSATSTRTGYLGVPGTALQLPTFTVDGWRGNAVDEQGVEWWVTRTEGWAGSPPIRLTLSARPERDGAFDAPSYRDPRVITVEGLAVAPDRTAQELAKDRLAAVLNDGSTLSPLTVTEPHLTRLAMVRLTAESKIQDRRGNAFEFSVQMTAPDPLRYSAELHSTSCPLPVSGGGLTFPLVFPLDFGSGGSGGRANLVNAGTVATWPVWRILGPCVSPAIVNTRTGEELAFDLVLHDDEVLVVDTDARTVLLHGTASRRSFLLPGSKWFPLRPGTTQVVFRADDRNPAARLAAEWRDAWT